MSARAQKIAAEFCKLVEVSDLYEYLGIGRDTPPDQAKAALAKKRKYMQAMQSNPKFRESARYLIKHYRNLETVLEDAPAHLEAMRKVREEEVLPMLVIALDGVLSDGLLTAEEEGFVRKLAVDFGVSLERYQQVLQERASFHNAEIQADQGPSPLLEHADDTLDAEPTESNTALRQLRGAEGHSWWDAAFTRTLLECIPGGPAELVDIYCRTALSALTLLPERRQLTYLGVDRSADRLASARLVVARDAPEHAQRRIALTTGQPDQLPIEDESVDYVLAIRALANLDDTRPVFAEAMRVLRPGGRMIVAEPDGFEESFYFEQNLVEYNDAFHRLVVAVDRVLGGQMPAIGRPGLSIGPTLTARMLVAGFEPDSIRVHASVSFRLRRFQKFLRRLQKYPVALAHRAGLEDSAELAAVQRAITDLEVRIPGSHVGMGGSVLPMFVAVGIKD